MASARDFCAANNLGKGDSGFCYSTLAVALQIWLRHPDEVEAAITEAVGCGGDTDTVAAIVGGMVGARAGRERLPQVWMSQFADWPRSLAWIELLGERLSRCKAEGSREKPPMVLFPFALMRNLLFIPIVLAHGFRRRVDLIQGSGAPVNLPGNRIRFTLGPGTKRVGRGQIRARQLSPG